jgi:hypothetical protein
MTKTTKTPAAPKNPAAPKAPRTSKPKKTAKTAAIVEQLASFTLLGEIITWNARSNKKATPTHTEVTNALAKAGFSPDLAKELLPRHAFARACRQMSDNRSIDNVTESNDVILFQFTKKFLKDKQWNFNKETEVKLHKSSGRIECDDISIQETVQSHFAAAMRDRTTNDITRIVQRLFEQNADLFPIRDQGGVYFVPQTHAAFISQVCLFLEELGGSVSRFPVPSGTQVGDRAIQDVVVSSMDSLIAEHYNAINSLTVHSREDTLASCAEKIKRTRTKIEAYAYYLKEKSEALQTRVDAADQELKNRILGIAAEREAAPIKTTGENLIFGFAATAVLRWMGHTGWTFSDTKIVLEKLDVGLSDATIRTQLGAGKTGQRGTPATLSDEQKKQLLSYVGK